jgi:hypothetical protein
VKRFLDSSTSQPEAFVCQTGSPKPGETTSLDITARRMAEHDADIHRQLEERAAGREK